MANKTKPSKLTQLKRHCEERGIAYGSARDAHFRGEFAIVRIGRALYVSPSEFDRWLESRTVRVSA